MQDPTLIWVMVGAFFAAGILGLMFLLVMPLLFGSSPGGQRLTIRPELFRPPEGAPPRQEDLAARRRLAEQQRRQQVEIVRLNGILAEVRRETGALEARARDLEAELAAGADGGARFPTVKRRFARRHGPAAGARRGAETISRAEFFTEFWGELEEIERS